MSNPLCVVDNVCSIEIGLNGILDEERVLSGSIVCGAGGALHGGPFRTLCAVIPPALSVTVFRAADASVNVCGFVASSGFVVVKQHDAVVVGSDVAVDAVQLQVG